TNAAFTTSVLAALPVFLPVRFEWIPVDRIWGYGVEALSIIGMCVIRSIMGFGFFGVRPAWIIAVVGMVAALSYSINYLRDFSLLTGSLVAYAVSFLVCYLMSYRSKENFDYDVIKKVTGDFDPEVDQAVQPDQTPLENVAAQKQGE